MLFKTIAAGTLAILSTTAVAYPSQVQARDDGAISMRSLDVTVRFFSKTTCSDSGGPKRDYSKGTCLPLSESSHGVKIVDHRSGCYVVKYTGSNCNGDSKKLDGTGCHNIGDEWNSLKFKCN